MIRVLPTLYDTRTKLAREVLSELRSKFREYLMESTVNFNTKLKEAASFGQPITEYDPGSRGYKDFVNLARELMGHRPVEMEQTPADKMSRPAELVQRAKQLAQLTNFQFGGGRGFTPTATAPSTNGNGVATVSTQTVTTAPIFDTPVGIEDFAPRITRPAAPEPAVETARTTEQKIEEFYGIKQMGNEVIFSAHFDHASQVLIAGDFNGWNPVSPLQMTHKPGDWSVKLPLAPGRYRYRFIVDGKWVTDPHNNYVETNQFGELNNVVEVE
jgi:hypothetical protein